MTKTKFDVDDVIYDTNGRKGIILSVSYLIHYCTNNCTTYLGEHIYEDSDVVLYQEHSAIDESCSLQQ